MEGQNNSFAQSTVTDVLNPYLSSLDRFGFSYQVGDFYLVAGQQPENITWMLHLTAVWWEIQDLLNLVLPVLKQQACFFRIPKDSSAADDIISGEVGFYQFLKIITIYTSSDIQALNLAEQLIPITGKFTGPEIPSAVPIGGMVYAEYFDPEKFIPSMWPFKAKLPRTIKNENQIIGGKYLIRSLLNAGLKGHVYKAIYLKHYLWFAQCVIKQGRKGIVSDENRRDMHDRLLWQYEVLKLIQPLVRAPKPIDLFKDKDHSYLVMELIKGIQLEEVIKSVYDKSTWLLLSKGKKQQLLDYYIKILGMVEKLHNAGLVHRDLTSFNFIITPENKVVMIDLEMLYDSNRKLPSPAFPKGTFGYRSPQQEMNMEPAAADDIFGLGGLAIRILTNNLPGYMFITYGEGLMEELFKEIGNNHLANLIIQCFSDQPQNRPTLGKLKDSFSTFMAQLS